MTKNHSEAHSPVITGYMPAITGSDDLPHKLCPVRSFELYLEHLNEKTDFLWQTPNQKAFDRGEPEWYKQGRIGESTLGKFMSELSTKLNLSQKYNHYCIRVSGCTNLTRAIFSTNQIMAVSGHKSVNSLAMYQRVNGGEKMLMGFSLAYNLFHPAVVYQKLKDLNASEKEKIMFGVPNIQDLSPAPQSPLNQQLGINFQPS